MSEIIYQRDGQSLNEAVCKDGGILRELYKEPGFGQISMRTVPPGQKVGGHRHLETNETWWTIKGKAQIKLDFGNRKAVAPPYKNQIVTIPAGVWHELENVGNDDVILIWWSDKIYNAENPDKAE